MKKSLDIHLPKGKYCISIYTPIYPGKKRMNKLLFRSQLAKTLVLLIELGLPKSNAHFILAKAYLLLKNERLWVKFSRGLSVFLTEKKLKYYTSVHAFKPRVHVGADFFVGPIQDG